MDFRRQLNLFNPDDFEQTYVTIVGVGNIGSHAALTLTRLGIQHFMLYDFDTVEEHNLSSQSYNSNHVGMPKVLAVAQQMREINPAVEIVLKEEKFNGNGGQGFFSDILVVGVDSLEARKEICAKMEQSKTTFPSLLIDGRVGGNQLELYLPSSYEEWRKTFPEKASEDPCGGRYISYVSVIIGGVIANQVKTYLVGGVPHRSIMMDVNSLQTVKNFDW